MPTRIADRTSLVVREMELDEVDLIIDYFHESTQEHLDLLGVDRDRLPAPDDWRAWYAYEYQRPLEERSTVLVIWELDTAPVGFSTADKITFGDEAHMHLHMPDREKRRSGIGTECVRETVDLYFRRLALKRLFCCPNAFNLAPNRTLQAAGFKYLKTHMTVPGPINHHQAITEWVLER
jgi:RimJ/RimL family protein N-acetyltransferase